MALYGAWSSEARQTTDGWRAVVTDLRNGVEIVCTHKHGNERSAVNCAGWEERARMKGTSRWDAQSAKTPRARRSATPTFEQFRSQVAQGDEVTDEDLEHSHEYVPDPDLVSLWHAMVSNAKHQPAGNLMFIGPSGSGKTDGARYLAALVGLEFTKVDSASMTDPEAWFGTREIVVEDHQAVTRYEPSDFVAALQRPGVLLLDEINRVRDEHRNVLIPVLDHTRAVMNPLTGKVIERHPGCFIIMSGNVGMAFTGTSAIDPAFMTRSVVAEFTYLSPDNEARVIADATGCDAEAAFVFARFGYETRAKAANDPEFLPVSTRELINMASLTAGGLSRDLAVKFVVMNAASPEGGSASIRNELQALWNGVRALRLPTPDAAQAPAQDPAGWTCPVHRRVKTVPAGVSTRTGKAYHAFKACPVVGCSATESRNPVVPSVTVNGAPVAKTCFSCLTTQPAGRNTICMNCGSTLP